MSKHGGFAAAGQIRGPTLQQLLMILHRAGQLPRSVAGPQVLPLNPGGAGSSTLEFDWFVDVPAIELDPANGGRIRSNVRLAGPLTISALGVDSAERQVRLELVVDADVLGSIVKVPPPDPSKQASFRVLATFSPVTVVSSKLTVTSGPPLPAVWTAFFAGPTFRLGLGLNLAKQLSAVPVGLPSEITPALEAIHIGDTATATVTTIVGLGFVTFGIDVVDPTAGIATAGNAADVVSFLSQSDLAAAVDPALTPALAKQMRTTTNDKIDSADVTSLSLTFGNAVFTVSGHAEADAGSADFSFDGEPILGRPAWVEVVDDEYGQYSVPHDETDEIWVDITNMQLDSNLAWWAILSLVGGGALLSWAGPAGPAMLVQLVNDVIRGIEAELVDQAESQTLLLRRTKSPLAGTQGPPVELTITSCQVFPDRMQSRALFTPDTDGPAYIQGPTSIDALQLGKWHVYTLVPTVFDYDLGDPELRVRWQVRRVDTNAIVKTVEHPPGDPKSQTLKIRYASFGAGHEAMNDFMISARVYRSGGGSDFDYLNVSLPVAIKDRLDRSRPYARWTHQVITPDVVVLGNGQTKRVGWRHLTRHSRVHRTDVPGRCLFVGSYTYDLDEPEYLDALPFPIAELVAHRPEVCDYCFYGGPTKTEPLVGSGKWQPHGGVGPA
jgi:hypothetical protein